MQRRRNRWHMCYWHEKNQYLVSKQGRKQITGIMNCSKSTANASRSCKRNDTDGVSWWHWTDYYIVETYAMISNTSLLKVKCRSIWLCKLIYPVICRLTLNKSDMHQTNTVLNIYKQWPLISGIRATSMKYHDHCPQC